MKELVQYHELLTQLVRREILVRYRHSALGVGWALLQPLGIMLLFTFVFTRAVSLGALQGLEIPYPLFVYVGVLPWTLFAAGLNGCVASLASHRDLVTKVYFPQQILPLTAIASAFFDFLVAGAVLVGLMAWYGCRGEWQWVMTPALVLLPVVVAIQLLLMIGLGLWLALGNLWYRDVKYLFTIGIQMWMFLTNVLYPLPESGSLVLTVLTRVNPMVPIISSYRAILLEGRWPEMGPLMTALAMGSAATVSAWATYRGLEGRFAERV